MRAADGVLAQHVLASGHAVCDACVAHAEHPRSAGEADADIAWCAPTTISSAMRMPLKAMDIL